MIAMKCSILESRVLVINLDCCAEPWSHSTKPPGYRHTTRAGISDQGVENGLCAVDISKLAASTSVCDGCLHRLGALILNPNFTVADWRSVGVCPGPILRRVHSDDELIWIIDLSTGTGINTEATLLVVPSHLAGEGLALFQRLWAGNGQCNDHGQHRN